MVDFRSKKFTFLSLLFMMFCLYNAGYFNHNLRIGLPAPKLATSETEAQFKVTIDPTKPRDQMTYMEKFLMEYALDNKQEQESMSGIRPVLMNKGDQVTLKYSESIQGEKPEPLKEATIIIGANQLKGYIESEVMKLEVGQKSQYKVFDGAAKKYIDVTVEIIAVKSK